MNTYFFSLGALLALAQREVRAAGKTGWFARDMRIAYVSHLLANEENQ